MIRGVQLYRVRSVDMNGFCGRDNHPEPSDVGQIVRPLRVQTSWYRPERNGSNGVFMGDVIRRGTPASSEPDTLAEGALVLLFGNEDEEACLEIVYTCATRDGRLLDLMSFELEPYTEKEQE